MFFSRTFTLTAVVLVIAAVGVAVALAARPDPEEPPLPRACVILDVSRSAAKEYPGTYSGGFQRFATRIAGRRGADFCVVVAAGELTGGSASWASIVPADPDDELRAPLDIRQGVLAADAQLAAVQKDPAVPRGGSQLVEGIAIVADDLRRGDEILLLSDAIQVSRFTGDFTRKRTDLTDDGIAALLDRLEEARLLPDLRGIALRIPYALTRASRPLRMGARRRAAVRAFWEAYADRTGARLLWSGGTNAA